LNLTELPKRNETNDNKRYPLGAAKVARVVVCALCTDGTAALRAVDPLKAVPQAQ